MVLFRFLFAPVLLAVAVLSTSAGRTTATPPPAARLGAAHQPAAASGSGAAGSVRDARPQALCAAPTRPAAGP